MDEIESLKRDMEKNGWDVDVKIREETPVLTVDVSDVFKATIEVDSIPYRFRYEFRDRPELTKEGLSDDPIHEFQEWYRTDEFRQAERDRMEQEKSRKMGEGPTVPARAP